MIKKISFLFVAIMFLASMAVAQGKSMNFGEVSDRLNQIKNTELGVKTNWQELKGQEVAWTGKVVNVKGGHGKAEITVANKERPTYKGYNIVLETFDMTGAGGLKIGQSIKFKGIINDYKGKKGNPVVIYLNSVELK
jgi:hypothetical protein